MEEAGGDWTEVSQCVDGNEGKKLQLKAEIKTKEISVPKLENVPTIVFNNVCHSFVCSMNISIQIIDFLFFPLQSLSSEVNNRALKGLKTVFCEMLSSKNIPDCE